MLGLIGKKVGMTQLFDEDGMAVPVTAIEARYWWARKCRWWDWGRTRRRW